MHHCDFSFDVSTWREACACGSVMRIEISRAGRLPGYRVSFINPRTKGTENEIANVRGEEARTIT